MKFISDLTTNTRTWQLLAFSALCLEFSALYFQHIMGLAPCIMCVYQRAAIWSIFFSGVIGAIGNNFMFARVLAYLLWATGAIWGLLIAMEHVEIQSATLSFLYSCDIIPNFPSWAPLHEWLPFLFEATGDCGDINWQFFGYTMPQMMIIVFSIYTVIFLVVLLGRLQYKKTF